ncbi:FMN-binding protein [Sedimenticola hydrogenitrophicus]|uniref:FMN-binding protein n=1 Tax=Sedimenticola hydrogenitrophicus TaxID=2967975 RepID=UPI0021A42194|nr:FMN-binding protein [Sedimenticola hydrogenitrophicus]
MSSTEQIQARPQTPSLAMLRTLGGVAMLSGLLVVLVFQWTQPLIEENKRIAIEQAVSRVIPGVVSKKDYILGPDGLFLADVPGAQGEKIYAAYNGDGKLQGIALEAAATGYQDVIRILYGYNQDCQCVTGIKVLKMAETPGLGDKIAFDPEFLENFKALDGRLNEQKSGLENAIVTVKHGSKREQWEIDSISGATISSKAIGRMINASGQRMFPLIIQHLDELRTGREN